ncbi:MAG: fasciclin domain-containing protein [Anaerolineales bacterium]
MQPLRLALLIALALTACSPAAPSSTPFPTSPPSTLTTEPPTAAPSPIPNRPAPLRTVAEIMHHDPRFTRLAAALQGAGVWEPLSDPARRFTIFAPVDSAFEALPADRAERLLKPELLHAVARHHVATGDYAEETLLRTEAIETLNGERVFILGDLYETALVGNARVMGVSVPAANGVVYAVDAVLWPLSAQTLAEAVDGDLRLAALRRAFATAGLGELLAEPGPYTLFAPTDDAFAALSDGDRNLLADPDVLRQVLLYHMVQGQVTSADAANLDWSTSLLDQPLICTVQGDLWAVNDSQVLVKDIVVANGMLHLVNEVLFPPIALGQ